MNSTADHTSPAQNKLQLLVDCWWAAMENEDLPRHLLAHLRQGDPDHPLSPQTQHKLASIAAAQFLPASTVDQALHVSDGQPYRLNLLQALASQCNDPDSGLVASSQQWQQRPDNLSDTNLDDVQLQQCTANWAQAERDPALLGTLFRKETQTGHVAPFEGDRAAAAKHGPQGIAMGTLNIVIANRRDPCLVLGSTICKANTLCRTPEHVALPSAHEVMKSFQHGNAYGNWTAIALDFKAAHKTVKVKNSEQGTPLFEVEGKLFHCTIYHFGAQVSADWWSRLGAPITRIAHELLTPFPHRMWLYVDDLLALLQNQDYAKPVCLLLARLACINAPVSWKKAKLGHDITWCGWTFSFQRETIHLSQSKLAKLRDNSRKVLRKPLEATLGLLMWATSTCQHLRPYMAPLYRDLHSAAGTLKLLHPPLWQHFLDALDDNATVVAADQGTSHQSRLA